MPPWLHGPAARFGTRTLVRAPCTSPAASRPGRLFLAEQPPYDRSQVGDQANEYQQRDPFRPDAISLQLRIGLGRHELVESIGHVLTTDTHKGNGPPAGDRRAGGQRRTTVS